ncbi:folylpolyglutamate synthase, mitochondrial [Diachasma alloeum]|uniref:folylpolyglutamate synthase, mitochondrial n=1 Tax=Diachasma alloeum TaxID=454923 RepID=UPI0007382264|nr:folylpolyglutamate synthase, mitochondrial [Diachasma alloeum]
MIRFPRCFSMIHSSLKVTQRAMQSNGNSSSFTYQDAVRALNSLQTNAAYIRTAPKHNAVNTTLRDTHKYLARSGIAVDDLDSLAVIHIAGTKGKGSTCALVDSILRAHGFRTALYTSPHLITVRERIKINGVAISEEDFTKHFWKLYNCLDARKERPGDMPPYFKFLTILMFHLFLNSAIDVAIIEVGIGGEYDCTNVLKSPMCTGITALGLDHTSMLGDTLSSIAWQKSGIFKPNVPAFTVEQPPEAMEVLNKRAVEKNCPLTVVPDLSTYQWTKFPPDIGILGDIQYENAALAVKLGETWINSAKTQNNENFMPQNGNLQGFDLKRVEMGLKDCKCPGRTQVLHGKSSDYYLDGAHTIDSMKVCVQWFRKTQEKKNNCKKNCKKILIFNSTGNRASSQHLDILREIPFVKAYFVPNISGKNCTDQENFTTTSEEQQKKCQLHCNIWGKGGVTGKSLLEVFERIREEFSEEERAQVLVTGSLHLVGAALNVLDPELTMKTDF